MSVKTDGVPGNLGSQGLDVSSQKASRVGDTSTVTWAVIMSSHVKENRENSLEDMAP